MFKSSCAWKLKPILVVLMLSLLGVGNAWAHSKHYGKATLVNATGNGTVYLSTASGSNSGQTGSSTPAAVNGTSYITWNCNESSGNDSKTYYARGTANNGYYYAGYATSSTATTYTAATTGKSFTATSTTNGSPNETKIYGFFKPVTIPSVATPSPNHFDATNTATTCSDYAGTVVFTTANADAIEDFKTPTITNKSGNGIYTITNQTYSANKVTVSYKFTGNGTYGGTNRSNSATITLTSAGGESTLTSTAITASFPNAKILSGSAEEIYTTFKTSDATQAGVQKTAVFDVECVDGTDNFDTPSITGTNASFFTYNSMSYADGKLTINYTYNGNKTAGDHTATLKLKVKDVIGGTDATYGSKSVTIVAHTEAEATNDVSVTTAAGVTTEYETWATGWTQANKADGNTIKLLRNVDLGELTASQTITKNLTLDLNGKTLSASLKADNTATYRRMFLLNTANKTFTVTDSKTGGTIDVTANYANVKYAIFVNQGNVVLNGGKIQIENTTTGNSDVTYATGVYVAAGATFTMNGGEIVAKHLNKRRADGVWGAGSTTSPSEITINGGKITANAYNYAYGIYSSGIVNINGGEILGETVGTSVAYGIYMNASANADDALSYAGTLNMKGGTVTAKTKTSNAYGILIQGVTALSETATDGTHSNKATAKCNITGGTIKALSTTTTANGVLVQGDTNSKNGEHLVAQIKNATIIAEGEHPSGGNNAANIYGVASYAVCDTARLGLRQGDIELTNCNVTATAKKGQTAVAVYVYAVQFSKLGEPYKEEEVATAGKVTIISGTYTAETTTGRYAFAVQSATRVKSILGKAEAYPTIIIHDGKFTATTGTTTARAVNAGGHTTIDGGEFIANAGSSDGYGIYHVAGKLKVSGVKIKATAPTNARGVSCECAIHDYTGYEYHSEAELNNLNDSAITTTSSTAYGVVVTATNKLETQARYDTYMAGTTNAVTKSYYDRVWSFGPQLTAAKVTINGGTYTAIGGTTTAYAAYCGNPSITTDVSAWVSPTMEINNATLIAKTNGTTTAYGVYSGGTTTVNNCDITVKPMTTTGYGVFVQDNKTTVNNTKITVTTSNPDNTKSAAAYGFYVNAAINYNTSKKTGNNYLFQGELVANEGNDVTVTATSGTTAYGIYVHAAKVNIPDGDFIGDYAYAGKATINGGKYTATASGTTAYAAGVADPVLQGEATATPTLIINDGKFKGTATSTSADVSVSGEPGYFVLNGGYYVKDENLDKKLGEGMNKVAVKSGTPEYAEGYRWRVTDNMTGEYVCKIKENGTAYASLEEALQVVNASPSTTYTIIMIANYTLSKGDYVLPAKTTLLIPYQSSQTAINGATPKWVTTKGTVAPAYKLTFANGVNMSVFGKIEASSTTYIVSSTATGIVGGPYGWLYLNEGSHIDLESGAFIYAWGYITGDGTINAKNGSTMYEDFQMGDWRGGAIAYAMNGNTNGLNGKGVFLLNDYFFQNIESEITYRPGATAIALSGTQLSSSPYYTDPVNMVGTSDALFLMNPATAGADTWVKKKYNADTDRLEWTLNSGASVGNMKIAMDLGFYDVDMDSKDFVLPITGNFTIIANEGTINLNNDMCILPGCEIIVKKEAILNIPSGKYIYVYDQDDRSKYVRYYYTSVYSPSWKVNPRAVGTDANTKLPDAKILVEGLIDVKGRLYTTAAGANIYSTRENAGKILFETAPPASISAPSSTTTSKSGIKTTLVQVIASSGSGFSGQCTYEGKALNPAWLKNEDGTYSKPTSANTSAGDTWVYMQSLTSDTYEWVLASEDGCFTTRKTGDTKTYVHPSDWVAVGSVNANHAYPSEDGTRMFVNTEAASTSASCKWWDVNKTPEVIDGTTYYVANNENFPNYGTYYYWDNSTSYWKPKKITVTWRNEDGTKITNGTYGDEYSFNTSPQFYGTNPKKTSTAIEKYDWIGWRDAEGNIYGKNETMPRATSDVTYTAYFNTTKYQYTITFKNNDNSDLWAGLVDAGTTGAELQALFEQKYNEKTGNSVPQKAPTIDKVFTFTGWDKTLATVTAAATYTAQYSESTRKYTVTFLNYNAVDELYSAEVAYNTRPVYPDDAVTPFRANTSAFSYEWTGWQQGTNTYGTTAALPVVTGNISYIATFAQTELKYQVFFKRQDGTIIDAPFFTYEQTPAAFPANPTMASTVSTDYTFREWSPATLVPVTEDGKVYTAFFDESPRKYTAHFVNYNGTTLNADQTINYNTVPTYTGTKPIKPNDARNSYEFAGWAWAAGDGWEAGSVGVGEALPAIRGEITFTAQYTPTLLQFDVIYQREDGFVILRDKKKWGESTAFPTTYTGATSGLNYDDETYSYTFDHWSPATVVNPVITDATYTAYYNRSVKTYSITTIGISPAGYGSVSPASLSGIPSGSTVTVNGNKLTVNGSTITATPAAATAQYTYVFDHWNNLPATVTANVANVEAVFTRSTRSYTILFQDGNGNTLTNTPVDNKWEYGTKPTYTGATTPTKAEDATNTYTFNGTWSDGTNTYATDELPNVTGDKTYTAQFTANPKDIGDYLDIVDWSGNGAGQSLTLNMNGYSSDASGSNWQVSVAGSEKKTKTDREANRTLVFSGLTLTAGEQITIIAYDASDNIESLHRYTVPHIYTSDAELNELNANTGFSDESIVYVREGTLTLNTNLTVKKMIVCPGAELEVNSGKTLKCTDLVLRTEAYSPAILTDNGTINATNVYYTRRVADKINTYPFGLPFNADISAGKVKLSNGVALTHGTHYGLLEYNGASRAQDGKADDTHSNWKMLTTITLTAGKGYQLASTSSYYYELYFPVKYQKTSSERTVRVSYHTGSAGKMAAGWNYIVSPFTQVYDCGTPASPEEALKISVLNSDHETYDQYVPTSIKPATPFFYQAEEDQKEEGSLVFDAYGLRKSAPRRMGIYNPSNDVPTQWIELLFGNVADELDIINNADRANIYLHPTKFSAEYELGYDVTKLSTQGARPLLWVKTTAGDLAFAALPDTLAQSLPLTVSVPAEGAYTFALNDNGYTSRIDNLILLDALTGTETDLRRDTYTCLIEEGQTTARFFLNVKMKQQGVTTEVDDIDSKSAVDRPVKLFIDGYIYILMPDGRMYDAVGKRVK